MQKNWENQKKKFIFWTKWTINLPLYHFNADIVHLVNSNIFQWTRLEHSFSKFFELSLPFRLRETLFTWSIKGRLFTWADGPIFLTQPPSGVPNKKVKKKIVNIWTGNSKKRLTNNIKVWWKSLSSQPNMPFPGIAFFFKIWAKTPVIKFHSSKPKSINLKHAIQGHNCVAHYLEETFEWVIAVSIFVSNDDIFWPFWLQVLRLDLLGIS